MSYFANYLYILAYSKTYKVEDWISWADNIIAENNDTDDWIYDVALSSDFDKLLTGILNQMCDENYFSNHNYTPTEVILGNYYIQYQKYEINLYELLEMSGDALHSVQEDECEYFYNLLNQIDKSPDIINTNTFIKDMEEYYKPLMAEALKQRKILERFNKIL